MSATPVQLHLLLPMTHSDSCSNCTLTEEHRCFFFKQCNLEGLAADVLIRNFPGGLAQEQLGVGVQ